MTFTGPNLHETGHSMSKATKHNWADTMYHLPILTLFHAQLINNVKIYGLLTRYQALMMILNFSFGLKLALFYRMQKSMIFSFVINLSLMRFPARRVKEGKCQKYLK